MLGNWLQRKYYASVLLFTIFSCIIIYVTFDLQQRCVPEITSVDVTGQFRYVGTARCHTGGRLGNRIFRYASLYGIGRQIGRIPFVRLDDCQAKPLLELAVSFPRLPTEIHIQAHRPNASRIVKFHREHKYMPDNATNLVKYDDEYILLSSIHLYNYQYFRGYETEIREMLVFSREVVANASLAMATLSNNLQSSEADFIRSAVPLVVEDLRREAHKISDPISVIMIGDDPRWESTMFTGNYTIPNVTVRVLSPSDPIVDMAFGALHCDSVLLSAGASTYGFWLAFLGIEKRVFYNIIAFRRSFKKQPYRKSGYFPPTWHGIFYNKTSELAMIM